MNKKYLWLRQATLALFLSASLVQSSLTVLGETQTSSTDSSQTHSSSVSSETSATVEETVLSSSTDESTEQLLTSSSEPILESSSTSSVIASETTTIPSSDESAVVEAESSVRAVTIYRLYNPVNGKHLYTTDANERKVLYEQHGWGYEGIGWYAPSAGQAVYRLYNPILKNHLYTADTNEVKVLTSRHGWKSDNNGRPVFYSGGQVNIYRLYNANLSGRHHWTTDTNEYNVLPRHGWRQEGIKFAALQVGRPIQTQYYENLPSGSNRIENTASHWTIEADVSLTGSGTGNHAKLTMNTPTSAISFGLQYDRHARAPHTNKTSFMVENIGHNFAGGQSYHWTNLYSKNPGASYRLMLTLHRDGTYVGYINGAEVIRGHNAALANQSTIALRVEGAARKRGDSITAKFSNIKLKENGVYNPGRVWIGTPRFNISNGISTSLNGQVVGNSAAFDRQLQGPIVISGTLNNLPDYADWDTAGWFDKVSGLVQFY